MKRMFITVISLFIFSWTFGQTLTSEEVLSMEKASGQNYMEYIASNGESFKVGDVIELGKASSQNDRYRFIFYKSMGKYYNVSSTEDGSKGEIQKIKIDGRKRSGFWAVFMCKAPMLRYEIEIEKALNAGEVASLVITKEEAIAKLKETKELVELGVMSEEEYETLKKELEPIIRN